MHIAKIDFDNWRIVSQHYTVWFLTQNCKIIRKVQKLHEKRNSLVKSTNQLNWFLWLLWKTSVTHTVSANQAPLIGATAPFVQKGLMLLEQSITWPKNLQNHLFFGIFMRQGPEMTSCVCWRDFQKNLFSEEKHFLHTEMIHKFSDDSVKVFWSMLIHVMRHTNT